jgi:hypothetical protein
MNHNLAQVPLIPLPQIGRHRNCGPDAVEGAARRAGVEPTKCPDGIRRFSFEQALLVDAELARRARR